MPKPSYSKTTLKVTCPKCGALPGNPCRDADGKFFSTWRHSVRVSKTKENKIQAS